MVYSTEQQPINDLRENLQTVRVKYEKAIKEGRPLSEAKKLFSVVKEIEKKLVKQGDKARD